MSICIPTYRQIDFLRETLRSVKTQDFEDYELIITDDTPGDSVAQLVASFGFDERLHYHRNPVSLGSPENWNEAVRRAKGDYVKLLHHDDRFSHSGALSVFVRLLDESPKANFAFSASSAKSITHNKNYDHCPSKEQVAKLIEAPEKLFLYNIIGAPSATIYRNKLGIEYDGNLQWLVDIDFYVRILSSNSRFVYTPEVLIETTTDAAHQITETYKNNAALDIFEHLYLYKKIAPKISADLDIQCLWFRLFEKYQIYSLADLEHYGTELPSLGEILLPFFMAYRQKHLKRTPFRVYARLPEPLKRIIRFFLSGKIHLELEKHCSE